MVAHILRLKLRLLANGFRRSPWQLVGVIVGGLYALGLVALLIVAAWFVADQGSWLTPISVLVSSVVVLGWAIIPPLLTGVDLTLEPARFVHFGIPSKKLSPGLILAGFISVPALLTVVAMLCFSVLWRLNAGAFAVALLANLATAVMAILACQYLTIVATTLRSKRRFREISFGLLFTVLIMLGPIINLVAQAGEQAGSWIGPVTEVLSYTPFGTFGAVPGSVVEQSFASGGLIHIGLGLLYLAGLVWLLVRATSAAVIAPPPQNKAAAAKGLGFFKWLPSTPTGAVAARCLTYWFRDPRYAISVIMVPLLPVLFYFMGTQTGNFTLMFLVGPIIGVLLGFSISADISYDNTAFALHVLTGVSGRADRAGRVLAVGLISIIPILAAGILPGLLSGQSWRVVGDLGLSLAALLVGFAVSSVVSARYTYSVPLPGDNPMKTPPGNGMRVAVTQLGTFALMGLLLVPVIIPFAFGLAQQSTMLGAVTLALALIYGAGLLFAGMVWGGRWFEQRQPELMQAVMLNK